MIYLMGEIVFYLLIAGLAGFLVGWLLRGAMKKQEWAQLERTFKINLASHQFTEEEIQLKSD